MESQSQNPEFRNRPENFHPCKYDCLCISICWALSVAYSCKLSMRGEGFNDLRGA